MFLYSCNETPIAINDPSYELMVDIELPISENQVYSPDSIHKYYDIRYMNLGRLKDEFSHATSKENFIDGKHYIQVNDVFISPSLIPDYIFEQYIELDNKKIIAINLNIDKHTPKAIREQVFEQIEVIKSHKAIFISCLDKNEQHVFKLYNIKHKMEF